MENQLINKRSLAVAGAVTGVLVVQAFGAAVMLRRRTRSADKTDVVASFLINKSVEECEAAWSKHRARFSDIAPTFHLALKGTLALLPSGEGRESLRAFKQLIEAGEIPTTKLQPTGERSVIGTVLGRLEQ